MEIIVEYGQLFIIIGCVVGFMAWGIGAMMLPMRWAHQLVQEH